MESEFGDTESAKKWRRRCGVFMQEVKRVSLIAGPMVVVSVLQYLVPVVSTMMVGHLGHLTLSSVAIATSLTNVTGFSLLVSFKYIHMFHFLFILSFYVWVVFGMYEY